MLLLTSTFLLIYTEQYLAEKRMLKEAETVLKTEYYFLYCARKLEVKLQTEEPIMSGGEFLLQDGFVNYVKEDTGATLKMTFNLTLSTGEKAIGIAYYNKNTKKMVKWVEKK
ncbi:MAG: competence type IV pilus minor pilin ComGG [Bacillus sp. (in: firmicutes)]